MIHGGKLLLDQSTLSEAIPSSLNSSEHSENESTVIHLVAYERSKSVPSSTSFTGTAERVHSSATPSSSSSEGLRNRQGATEGPNRQPNPAPEGGNPGGGERGDRGNIPHQPSQPRQPPIINPLLHHRGPMLPNPMPAGMQNIPGAGGMANPFLQAPPFYHPPYNALYANQLQQWYYNYYRLGPC